MAFEYLFIRLLVPKYAKVVCFHICATEVGKVMEEMEKC